MKYRIFIKLDEFVQEELVLDDNFSINVGDTIFIGDSLFYYVESREIIIADDNKSIMSVDLNCHQVDILGDK